MTAETVHQFKLLEDQAKKLRDVFTSSGYEPVSPAIMQPADIFMNQIGEALRSRTYVFSSVDGEELCLRPDLTVPTCRLYLERHPNADACAKYCYNGPAFRFQPREGDNEQPREFRQAGIENIGVNDKGRAETEVLQTVIEALEVCGISDISLRFGDLGIFHALLNAIQMPDRWRARLKNRFWRPEAFRELLQELTDHEKNKKNDISTILAKLTAAEMDTASELVMDFLEAKSIPLVGTRDIKEITEKLMDELADIKSEPLPKETAVLIENYLSITARPKAAGARISDLASAAGINLDYTLQEYNKRLELFSDAGIDISNAMFSAEYGRNLEYYTGLVFQLEIPSMGTSEKAQIAGGGRYDNLIGDINSGRHIPAIGCGIHTERLLAAAEGINS